MFRFEKGNKIDSWGFHNFSFPAAARAAEPALARPAPPDTPEKGVVEQIDSPGGNCPEGYTE
jgi:hypothetical protein